MTRDPDCAAARAGTSASETYGDALAEERLDLLANVGQPMKDCHEDGDLTPLMHKVSAGLCGKLYSDSYITSVNQMVGTPCEDKSMNKPLSKCVMPIVVDQQVVSTGPIFGDSYYFSTHAVEKV